MSDRLFIVAEPLLVGATGGARLCGVSRPTWDRWSADGSLGPRSIKIGAGGRKLWRVAELREWVGAGCPPRVKWEYERINGLKFQTASG